MLKEFERNLLSGEWKLVHEGLEVQLCPAPNGAEVFILCRSAQRREKERAMHDRFEKKIEKGLKKIAEACKKRKQKASVFERRADKLLGRNTRAAGLFEAQATPRADGFIDCTWSKKDAWRTWAESSEGCYMLRSNVTDWSPEELWRAYIQPPEPEYAFRIPPIRFEVAARPAPKAERCGGSHFGLLPVLRIVEGCGAVLSPGRIAIVDIVLPTRNGVLIGKHFVDTPTGHRAIPLQRLGLHPRS